MDEDVFNLELRKFLKQVGITTQREIEKATRRADPPSGTTYKATAVITVDGLDLRHVIEADIATG